jgi:predicted PurR-regulated permease PerM
METRWSATTKYIVAIGLVLVAVAILYISRAVLGMIIFALIFALLAYPIIRFLNRRLRFPRGLAAITAYLILALIVALIPIIITPFAIDAIRALNFNAFVEWLEARLGGLEEWLISIRTVYLFDIHFSLAPAVDPILDVLAGTAPQEITSLERLLDLVPSALDSVTSVASFLASTISSVALTIFLTLIISIYFSIDAERFYHGLISQVPQAYQEELRTLLKRIAHVWSSFLRGQFTVSLILALITWLGATAVGLPGAFILGLIAGVLALIPSLGPVLALIPAVIVALVQGSTYLPVSNLTFALIVFGLYGLIQQLEGNLITPRIVGQAIELPPVVVLVGVIIGTSTAGLLGAVLAAPIVATGRVILLYAWNKILDRDPFYQLEEPEPPQPLLREPVADKVRSAYERMQEQYRLIASAALPWPDDEEE